MKYILALLIGYYILEVIRHLQRQIARWDKGDSSLPIYYKLFLVILIGITAIFWPVFYFRSRFCT